MQLLDVEQLTVATTTGVLIHLAVQPVGEVNRSEPDCAITPPPSTTEKTASGLDQLTRQEPVILSTAQVSLCLETN